MRRTWDRGREKRAETERQTLPGRGKMTKNAGQNIGALQSARRPHTHNEYTVHAMGTRERKKEARTGPSGTPRAPSTGHYGGVSVWGARGGRVTPSFPYPSANIGVFYVSVVVEVPYRSR